VLLSQTKACQRYIAYHPQGVHAWQRWSCTFVEGAARSILEVLLRLCILRNGWLGMRQVGSVSIAIQPEEGLRLLLHDVN
jgi:hypothetical protein